MADQTPARYTISYTDIVAHAERDTWHEDTRGGYTCGAFSYRDGVIHGPAAYMAERGAARLRRIEAGEDYLVNYGLSSGLSPNAETAVLVSLQTDYAAWVGEQDLLARQEAARKSQQEFMAREREQRITGRTSRRRR